TTDRWALILASEGSRSIGEAEVTFIVDGEPRVLKPFGRIDTELYDIKADPRQTVNIVSEEVDVAMDIYRRFIGFLSELGAADEVVKPWLRCVGLKPL
ncbi:MAG: hypothetical protein QXQ29_04200, partial [Candidatus Bathyarchaeia archaeon]